MERIFESLEKMTTTSETTGVQVELPELLQSLVTKTNNILLNSNNETYDKLSEYLNQVIKLIDTLCNLLRQDDDILISVKHQKILRSCLQNITSLGISMCLIPGVGISLSKQAPTSGILPKLNLDDQQKYTLLVMCTEFFTRIYEIPVLRKMIITFHLSEYLAALIQLSYAPLKKPGIYENFVMTSELYDKLMTDKKIFAETYEQVITKCFQPILMKELLVLQSVIEPPPPPFLKRTVSKALSSCLLAPGGLLSLIRCFIECYTLDSGLDWKKNHMICKIITVKHGAGSENEYLSNICSQLSQILSLSNHHYLQTALLCLLSLHDKYSSNETVNKIYENTFYLLNHDHLLKSCNIPGTVAVTPEEVEKEIYILDVCLNNDIVEKPYGLLINCLYLLFQIQMKCQKEDMKQKAHNAILKCFDCMERDDISLYLSDVLFGKTKFDLNLKVESHDAGIIIKVTNDIEDYPISEAATHFLEIFHKSDSQKFVQNVFETLLKWLLDIINKRPIRNRNYLPEVPDQSLANLDQKYSVILQMLSEISASDKVLSALKTDPSTVLNFVECILLNNDMEEDCITISLVLLNTILSSGTEPVQERCSLILPILKKISQKDSNMNSILCKETLNLIKGGTSAKMETACEKAIAYVFDDLLPVRAHGIMQLTKLIAAKDLETLSKKHYLLCLFQQQLKDSDSYIYLSAINGIAALGVHCPEEVLEELAKEYIQMPSFKSLDQTNSAAEIRLKVGDVIVKVTKGLGEMAVTHKTLLLNTVLCVCRDGDPLLRTSALSNLAEIARVLNYKMGSIIYEVLILIWETIENDQAVECRRAAVLVITNLLKGLGQETLVQLKDKLLPIYRTLKTLYRDDKDSVVRLHAQIALEELNDIVSQFLKTELKMDERMFLLNKPNVK